jgi:hypothetical protein
MADYVSTGIVLTCVMSAEVCGNCPELHLGSSHIKGNGDLMQKCKQIRVPN